MPDYLVKWKGQSRGPYSVEDLRRMFEEREIGPMHEIFFEGNWITARAFFRRNTPTASEPASLPSAATTKSRLLSLSLARPTPSDSPTRVIPAELAVEAEDNPVPPPIRSSASSVDDIVLMGGFWQRATALFLDLLVIVGLPIWALDAYGPHELLTLPALVAIPIQTWIIGGLVFLFVCWSYATILECSPLKATLGKRALGLIVVQQDGEPVTLPTAALRSIVKIGSGAMLLTGFFLAAFSPRKQAFHDLVSKTAVVYPVTPSLRFR